VKLIQTPAAIPTHIISGFLGAGKTTLLQHLLRQKPKHETWAILMNEFGQIGVDQQLLPQQQGYAIKELLGGCLCCSSQLPMQIALSRLLSETKPDRLFIEPTGLGHPAQLLEQLTESHWQQTLAVRALVTVLDGSRLHEQEWVSQNLYQDQLKAAQIIVVSHGDLMSFADGEALEQLKKEYAAYGQDWIMAEQGQLDLAEIDVLYQGIQRKLQPLLKVQRLQIASLSEEPIKKLPYHYVETAQGYSVAGWKLPKRWQFDFYALLDLFCATENWLRIKGIFNTDQGWIYFNFNPQQLNYKSGEEGIDNRIEIITDENRNWENFEMSLLAAQLNIAEENSQI